jgi:tight adherence protein C
MSVFVLLAFVTGTLFAFGASSLLGGSSAASQRLARLAGEAPAGPPPSLAERLEKLLAPLASRAGGLSEEMRLRLVQSGMRGQSALVIYVGGRLALPLALALLVLLASALFGLDDTRRLTGLGMAAIGGYVGPSWWVDRQRKRRQAEVRRALPDALDLLVVCLEAGLSLGAGFARVAREFVRSSPSLCEELRLVTSEMQAGKSGADALRALSDRVGILEVSSLAAMLIQTERFGTSVSDALRVHCEGMRVERLQRAEEAAQKAAVKMLIPAAVFIFPATSLVLVGPAVLQMIQTFSTM